MTQCPIPFMSKAVEIVMSECPEFRQHFEVDFALHMVDKIAGIAASVKAPEQQMAEDEVNKFLKQFNGTKQ